MLFLLLRTKGCHHFCICDHAIRRYFQRVAKVKFIFARRHAKSNTLGKAPEVIGKDFDPDGLVGATREVTLFVHVASGGVDDRVCLLSGK